MKKFASLCFLFSFSLTAAAQGLPVAPTDPGHPGSKSYSYGMLKKDLKCEGRDINLYLPSGGNAGQIFPVVVFGHGQALGLPPYKNTFEHLAKKGIALVFPAYDNGFFDQDWQRMGRDFVTLADCALTQEASLDAARVVYSGHSKGAYIASIAAGLAPGMRAKSAPRAIVLFEAAGADIGTLTKIAPDTALTVVFSDRDTVVKRDLSETIYAKAASQKRQFIFLKSYSETTPKLEADHMWPLNEKSFFGGGPEGPFHYYGSWKWLVAAAQDLTRSLPFQNPFLYGDEAVDKGLAAARDDVKRNW